MVCGIYVLCHGDIIILLRSFPIVESKSLDLAPSNDCKHITQLAERYLSIPFVCIGKYIHRIHCDIIIYTYCNNDAESVYL